MDSIVNEFNSISVPKKSPVNTQTELLDSDLVNVTIDPELRDIPVYRSQLPNMTKKKQKPTKGKKNENMNKAVQISKRPLITASKFPAWKKEPPSKL